MSFVSRLGAYLEFVKLSLRREAFQSELTSTCPSFCASEGLAIPAYPSLLAHSSRHAAKAALNPLRTNSASSLWVVQ